MLLPWVHQDTPGDWLIPPNHCYPALLSMGTLQAIAAFAEGGLKGQQAHQRDWSPYVAHFTAYASMEKVRGALAASATAQVIRRDLIAADRGSYNIFRSIVTSGEIRSSNPTGKRDIDACVCLSECTLPGILAHCEKYGRFGFVFKKGDLYSLGARPCIYVDRDARKALRTLASATPSGSPERKLFCLSNIYSPPGVSGAAIQDYTHEREWRIFNSIDVSRHKPFIVVHPSAYEDSVRKMIGSDCHRVAVDLLMEWGI